MASVLLLVLMLPLQQHDYSKEPGRRHSERGGPAAKNPVDYTSDGDFLKQTSEHNAFLVELFSWAKEHAESALLRRAAGDLLSAHNRFAEDLRKLAARKHVSLGERLASGAVQGRTFLETNGSTHMERNFVGDVSNHVLVEIARFETESRQGSDPDIRRWASEQIRVFENDQRLIEELKPPRPKP